MALPVLQAPRYPAGIKVARVANAEEKNAAIVAAQAAIVAQTPPAPPFIIANVNKASDFP